MKKLCSNCQTPITFYAVCCRKCSDKNRVPWNKGKSFPQMKGNQYAKGNKPNNTSFKKGQKPWNFIDGNVSYNTLHKWLIVNKPRAEKCQHCGKTGSFTGEKQKHWNIQWANKNHSYKRVLKDYIALCTPCHNRFDVEHNGRVNRNQWVNR